MRKIKFRAWDKQTRDMLEFFTPSMEFYNKRLNRYRDFFDRHIIQMQFTGLHDRNGREIYEGDILELANGEGALRSVVEYHAPSFCHRWLNLKEAKLRGINVEPLLWNTHIIFKVIGNIYEHPHLLEVEGNETS